MCLFADAQLSFSKVLEEEEEEAAKDDDEMGAALYDFSELSKSLAHMYIGERAHLLKQHVSSGLGLSA